MIQGPLQNPFLPRGHRATCRDPLSCSPEEIPTLFLEKPFAGVAHSTTPTLTLIKGRLSEGFNHSVPFISNK